MSEKPIAVVLAGIGVVSLCAVCALGPAAVGAAVGWAFGWVTDLSPMANIGVAIVSGLLAYSLYRRWGATKSSRKSESTSPLDPIKGEHR